jgi:DNA-binding CsgD family transcriptional regulator
VVLTGEAGIGKTRLAAELLARCAAQGFVSFAGAGDELDRHRPFGVVVDALRVRGASGDARGEVARLLEGPALGPPEDAGTAGWQARIADLLTGWTLQACRRTPMVIVLDDLQWADEASLVVASHLARQTASAPLLVVCALRPYPLSAALRVLLASLDYRGAHRLALDGLSEGDVAELAAGLAGARPGPSLSAALGAAGGNPFYVTVLLSCLLADGGAGVSEEGLVEVADAGPPASVGVAILEALRFLPEATLAVLAAAAVAGRGFSVTELALICPATVSDVAAALAPAQRAGVVEPDADRLVFRHDLIREAIYQDMAPAVRKALHRHLASGLAEAGAGAERVAAQVMLGADPGDEEAISWLRRAAGEAAATAPGIAAELLGRALVLAAGSPGLRREILGELVRPLLWTGQARAAEEMCAEGLGIPGPGSGEALFWLGLADARLLQGRFAEARATCGEAMTRPCLEDSDRLQLQAVLALAGVYLGDQEGVTLARSIVKDSPRCVSRATAGEAVAQWELFSGRADRAVAAFEQVESLRHPAEVPSRIWGENEIRVQMWHGLALLELDRLEEAAQLLACDIDAKFAVPALPHAFLAACHYHAGRFGAARREARAAMAAAEAAGAFRPASAQALAATVALREGKLEDAERLVARAEATRAPAEAAGDTIVRWTRMLVAEARGRTEEAAEAGAGALQAYLRAGFASYVAWHAPDLVRVALRAGRPAQAEAVVEAAQRSAAQLAVASRRTGALRAQALLAGDVAGLLGAVEAARQAPRPLDLALALRDAAAGMAAAGDPGEARRLGRESLTLLAGLGAAGDERVARAMLRRAGLVFGARARHAGASHGWEALTAAERRVISLLAEGRSNPEIAQVLYLSARTVGWHVSNALRKLGLSSRVELAAEAARRGLR